MLGADTADARSSYQVQQVHCSAAVCCTGSQVQVENLHGSESHSLQLRVHGEYCALQYSTLQ